MVKNKNGGNRHKKMARKNQNTFVSRKIRKAYEDGEMYAKVEKMFGGGHAGIICNDGRERLLVIRKKFSGRNKRDNHISEGTYLLVGLREWEVVSQRKKEKADLLEVYSQSNVEQLKKEGIVFNFDVKESKEEENMIEFSNEDNVDIKFNINMDKKENTKIMNDVNTVEFDWDDI